MNIIYYGGTDGLVMTQDNYQYLKETVFICWPGKESTINQTVAIWMRKGLKKREPADDPIALGLVKSYLTSDPMRPADLEKLDYPNNVNV